MATKFLKFPSLIFLLSLWLNNGASQTNTTFIKNDSVYKEKISTINNALRAYLNLLNTQDAADRAKDEVNGGGRLLADRYYPLFFDKYFTLLSFEKEGLPDGNSATIKTSSNDTKLNLNLSYKKLFTIINVGADLNLSSNTGSIFSGKDLTANSTYYMKFSFLKSEMNKLWYDYDRRNEMRIKRDYKMHETTLEFNSHYVIKYSAIIKQLRAIDSTINVLYDKQANDSNKKLIATDEAQLIKLLEEKTKLKKSLTEAGLDENSGDKISKLKAQIDKDIYDIEVNANAWTNIRLGWFSGGVSYSKDKYITYDSTRSFEKKVTEKLFDRWSITGNFNLIYERSDWWQKKIHPRGFRSLYGNIGWTISRDNNFFQLKETDFITRQVFTRNPISSGDSSIEVVSTQKVKDITGKTFKSDWSHNLGVQSTIVFGKSNFWGINMGLNGTFSKLSQPLFNSRAGILFRFIDSNDGKSKVNFEVFLQLKDLVDNLNTGKSTWDRKVIGITTTVPFNKTFFK